MIVSPLRIAQLREALELSTDIMQGLAWETDASYLTPVRVQIRKNEKLLADLDKIEAAGNE